MVVSSPQEFPLTRENVILIRQLFPNSLSIQVLLQIIHPSIARPGNENLVALQPTVSGNFALFKKSFETFCDNFQEISADQSVTSVSPEDRRCLFPEVQRSEMSISCFPGERSEQL